MHKLGMIAFSVAIFLMAWRRDEYLVVVFLAIFIAGAAVAIQLRPSVARIIADARIPDRGEIGALALGTVLAFMTFSLLDGWLDLYRLSQRPLGYIRTDTPESRLVALLSWCGSLGTTVFAAGPMLRSMFRRHGPEGAPLWPGAVGVAASLPVGFGVFLIWSLVGPAIPRGYVYVEDYAKLALMIPGLALLFAPGLFLWLRAWRAVPGDAFEPAGVLGSTIRAFVTGWAVLGAVALYCIAMSILSRRGSWPNEVLSTSATLLVPVAIAWIAGLWRLTRAEDCGLLRAGAGWLVLGAANLLSLSLTAMTWEARDWAPVMLIFGLPVLAVIVVMAGLLVPWILRRVVRGPARGHVFV